MKRLHWIAAALAAPLFMAGQAMADFTYSTATTPTSQAFGTASTAQFGPTASASTLSGNQGISLLTIAVQTTATSPTDTGSVNFSDVITINQTAGHGSDGPGSGMITITGTITWTRSDTGGQSSAISNVTITPSPLQIGNTFYTLSNGIYAQPTVNVPLGDPAAGRVSATLVVTTVPEPSSMAALCVGGLVLAAPRLRRLVRRIGQAPQV